MGKPTTYTSDTDRVYITKYSCKKEKMNGYNDIEIIEPQDLRPCMVDDRVCSDCKTLKGAEEFYISTSYRLHKRTNEYRKQVKRCSSCKTCMTARTKKWVKKNHTRYLAYQALYKRQLRRHQKASIIEPVNS